MDLTPREATLASYIVQLASDPRVRGALMRKSVGDLKSALIACMAEDLPSIARMGVTVFAMRVAMPAATAAGAAVERAAGDFIGGIFKRVDEALSGKAKRR